MERTPYEEAEEQTKRRDKRDLSISKRDMKPSAAAVATLPRKREPPSLPYKDEIVGRRVAVLLKMKDSHSCDFFEGVVSEMGIRKVGKALEIMHSVQFDNGDKLWFDMTDQEKESRLHWSYKKAKLEVIGISSSESESEEKADEPPLDATELDEGSLKKPAIEMTNREEKNSNSSNEARGDTEDSVGKDEGIYADLFSLRIPHTLDAVVRLMDVLEPGQNYYQRQVDRRGGCSVTRKKLRDFAHENTDHPAVAHWVSTSKWRPPDHEKLASLMELIKTKMI